MSSIQNDPRKQKRRCQKKIGREDGKSEKDEVDKMNEINKVDEVDDVDEMD